MSTPAAAFTLLPEQASDLACHVDALFNTLLAVCGLLVAGLVIVILTFCIRYRQGSSASRTTHKGTPAALEITWTSLTALAFIGIFVWSAVEYFRMTNAPANAWEIHVVAKQWMWKTQHPNGRREINELHLLVGQPVKLIMTSQDVIHDFDVPAFRTKQDVLPDRYTTEWFTPTKPGKYHLYCAEYCGMDHSHMGGWVYVLEPGEYARWLGEQAQEESIVAAGGRLFQQRGCTGCHGQNSQVHAPELAGIFGKPVALADGKVITADEQYLHDSILLPARQITAGYENIMPSYAGQLGQEEVMQLVAYLKSLARETPSTP